MPTTREMESKEVFWFLYFIDKKNYTLKTYQYLDYKIFHGIFKLKYFSKFRALINYCGFVLLELRYFIHRIRINFIN